MNPRDDAMMDVGPPKKRAAVMWESEPQSLIPTKAITMDEAGGSLQYIADVTTKTATGAYSILTTDSARAITLNVKATSARTTGGVPVVDPRDVRFEFETKHIGIGGYVRSTKTNTNMSVSTDYDGEFYFDGTTAYTSQAKTTTLAASGGAGFHTAAATAIATEFTDALGDMCLRKNVPRTASVTTGAGEFLHIDLPTLARNTRFEIPLS